MMGGFLILTDFIYAQISYITLIYDAQRKNKVNFFQKPIDKRFTPCYNIRVSKDSRFP